MSTVNFINCDKNYLPLAWIEINFIRQSGEIWVSLSVDGLKMSINIKSPSPLNPSLTQEGWGPHLTSWPEDSAAGPLHCHNYGGVSCVDAKWKVKRGSGGNIDVKKTVWQKWCKGGGQRKAEYKKKRTSRGTKNSHSHSGSYMIRHMALPLWEHIDWNTFTYRDLSCTMDTTLTIVKLNRPRYCLGISLCYWSWCATMSRSN